MSKKSKLLALRDMQLSLEPQCETLSLRVLNDKGEVVTQTYILKEPTEAASVTWRDALVRGTRLNDDGKPVGISGISNTDALLLSMCLFLSDGGSLKPVDKKVILGWPSRVVKPLVEACREMGGFDDEDEENLEELEKRKVELDEKINKLRARQNGHASVEDESLAKN